MVFEREVALDLPPSLELLLLLLLLELDAGETSTYCGPACLSEAGCGGGGIGDS